MLVYLIKNYKLYENDWVKLLTSRFLFRNKFYTNKNPLIIIINYFFKHFLSPTTNLFTRSLG